MNAPRGELGSLDANPQASGHAFAWDAKENTAVAKLAAFDRHASKCTAPSRLSASSALREAVRNRQAPAAGVGGLELHPDEEEARA